MLLKGRAGVAATLAMGLVSSALPACRTLFSHVDNQRASGGSVTAPNQGGSPGADGATPDAPGAVSYVGDKLPTASNQISVDALKVVRPLAPSPLGVNLNYLRDSDLNRPSARPLTAALQDLGAHVLRYPGGEKANFYKWSQAPWTSSQPQIYNYYKNEAKNPVDFDSYMQTVKAVGAEPYLVVGYTDSNDSGISEDDYLTAAVQWVKYANITKQYNVKYWEIGNENYIKPRFTAAGVGRVVSRFAKAMKAVDPSIKIGTSGQKLQWWQDLLAVCAGDLDFLTFSNYPQPPTPEAYLANTATALNVAQNALTAIDTYTQGADKQRLQVIAAEFNPVNWQPNAVNANDLWRALATFDMIGALLTEPRIVAAMFWTTHWIRPADQVFFALDEANGLTPIGQAVGLWGRLMQEQLVTATPRPGVSSWATHSPSKQRTTVFLVNKGNAPQAATLAVQHLTYRVPRANVWLFSGQKPTDTAPTLAPQAPLELTDNRAVVTLPPYSITAYDLQAP